MMKEPNGRDDDAIGEEGGPERPTSEQTNGAWGQRQAQILEPLDDDDDDNDDDDDDNDEGYDDCGGIGGGMPMKMMVDSRRSGVFISFTNRATRPNRTVLRITVNPPKDTL